MPGSSMSPSAACGSQRALSLAVSLVVAVAAVVAAGPRLFPYRIVFVRSASMAPALAAGSLAVLTPVAAGRVEPGEIITFPRPTPTGGLITHRVVAIDEGPEGRHLITKGDASAAHDPWLLPTQGMIWRLRLNLPYLGYALGALSSSGGWATAAVVLTAAAGRRFKGAPRPGRHRRPWPGRAATLAVVAVAVALLPAALPGERGTSAALMAQAQHASNEFSTAALAAPSGLSGAASGHDVALTWNAAANEDGYLIEGAGNGTSSDCSAVSFASIGTATATSYTDGGRSTPEGTWFCYRATTTSASWTSVENNPVIAAQLGFVAGSLTMANAGNTRGCSGTGEQIHSQAGILDCGDQVMVHFNQAVDPATGPSSTDTVCTDPVTNTVVVATTTTIGLCTILETTTLGSLAGGTLGADARFATTAAWSNGNKTLTLTIGAKVSGLSYPAVSSASWTLTSTSTTTALLSATGAFHVCTSNADGGNCRPSTAAAASF